MSDDPAAPPGPEPIPLSQARPVRPPVTRKTPSAPKPPSKLKAYLVIGIIVSTIVLLGLIAWSLYNKLNRPPRVVRNVKVEWENAWTKAHEAWKETFKIESKVWVKGEDLTPEDITKIKSGLLAYQKTSDTFHELNALMLKEGKGASKEMQDMGERLIILKSWLWDANGVVDPANKPPKYGGLFIPMYKAEKRMSENVKALKEIKDKAQEILDKGNAEEIEKTAKKIKDLENIFVECREEFTRLDDDLKAGLTLPDLKAEQLQDLEDLRRFAAEANMGFREARDVRFKFREEKKEEAPKEQPKEPPKEPPKDEKKEEPPKKEDPPKEEPPK
jgi:hypothetical protein